MEGPRRILENWPSLQMMMAEFRQTVARMFLQHFASTHGLSEVEAATCLLRNPRDVGYLMGIVDSSRLAEVETYALEVLRRHETYPAFIYGAGVRPSLVHRDYTARVEDTTTVGPWRSVFHHLGYSDSTASLENHYSAGLQLLDDNGKEEFSYIDGSLHLTPMGRGFSRDTSPRAEDMMLEHIPGTGHREDLGWKCITVLLPVSVDSSLNWSAEADPTDGTGSAHTSIDIRALLLQYLDSEEEELRETESENARANRILETTIGTLLPAAIVGARDFFSDAPDIIKLAGNLMLPALLGFCFIGMLHKRRAGRILRLATCAGIAATTLGVSSQLSDGIYISIAAVAGVALSFITLTA